MKSKTVECTVWSERATVSTRKQNSGNNIGIAFHNYPGGPAQPMAILSPKRALELGLALTQMARENMIPPLQITDLDDGTVYKTTLKRHWFSGPEQGKCSLCSLSAHRGKHFTNGGVVCDNPDGPCACGAWHHDGKPH